MSAPPSLFLDGRVSLYAGDCLEVLKTLADNSIDAVCTDPPYHLTSIVKRFGKAAGNFGNGYGSGWKPTDKGLGGAFARTSRGFMGKQWDGGDIAFRPELWTEVLRVLKPGGHVAAFSGTRTYHRMACAIEDAGFEIRDQLAWCYGSGFPKSHDVSKGIDKAAGAKRPRLGTKRELGVIHGSPNDNATLHDGYKRPWRDDPDADGHYVTAPATDAAKQWQGWGTALKPAWECIALARKPLSEPTIAANVLRWGTGAINVDACRVGTQTEIHASKPRAERNGFVKGFVGGTETAIRNIGRWPPNLAHDGSPEVLAGFPDSRGQQGDLNETGRVRPTKTCFGDMAAPKPHVARNDSGSAARFFFSSKADADDRIASRHPTVKPVDLMQWLCRLICPPNGRILDPFAGTGTTGEAAWREGFSAILIEREAEYQADIARRMDHALKSQRERKQTIAVAKGRVESLGGLFADGAL